MILKITIESGENIKSSILLADFQPVRIRVTETDLTQSYFQKSHFTTLPDTMQKPVIEMQHVEFNGPALHLFNLMAERKLSPQSKNYILKALDHYSSADDLARAVHAFKNDLDDKEKMAHVYGESGKTKREIYNLYSLKVEIEKATRKELEAL
jgi:hypothetical protein